MYVQPVYAARQLSDAAFPILRFVLTKYGDDIGIGSTLRESLQDLLQKSGGSIEPTPDPDPDPDTEEPQEPEDPEEPLEGSVAEQIDQLLTRAEAAFEAADQALADGDLAEYQTQVERAQELIGRALELRN